MCGKWQIPTRSVGRPFRITASTKSKLPRDLVMSSEANYSLSTTSIEEGDDEIRKSTGRTEQP